MVRDAIGLVTNSDRVLITRNDVAGGVLAQGFPPFGPFGGHPDDLVIDRNTIHPVVALFQVPNASITRNRVLGSPSDPIGAGIYIRGSRGQRAGRAKRGVRRHDRNPLFLTQATLTRNLVSENASDGILVQRAPSSDDIEALIDRNRSSATAMRHRRGRHVCDLDGQQQLRELQRRPRHRGRATPAINGGGNKARANGNPPQCLNVRCK